MSKSRQKPYFSQSTVDAILTNFKRSMTDSELFYDDNLVEAVEAWVRSPKSEAENHLLTHVATDSYRLLYEKGSASFGVITPTVLKEYKAKYPMPVDELRKDPDLYRQAMLDSVELNLKKHLETYKTRESNLKFSLEQVRFYARPGTGRIIDFLKAPFTERSTKVEVVETVTEAPVMNAASTSEISGSLSVN